MARREYGVGHEIGLRGIDPVAFLSANFFNLSSVSALAKYKLVLFGDQSVGKSSIIMRFKYDHFVNIYKPTIGNDFFTETMYHEDRKIKLQLWDISGQGKFKRYMLCYVHNSSVAIIIYDVARRESFLNTSKWTEEVRTKRGSDVIIVLVGNKTDLVDERQVSVEEGEAKAQELGVMFIETSAKTGLNIKDLFTKIAAALSESPRKQEDIDKADLNRTLIFFGPNSIYHNQPKL